MGEAGYFGQMLQVHRSFDCGDLFAKRMNLPRMIA